MVLKCYLLLKVTRKGMYIIPLHNFSDDMKCFLTIVNVCINIKIKSSLRFMTPFINLNVAVGDKIIKYF